MAEKMFKKKKKTIINQSFIMKLGRKIRKKNMQSNFFKFFFLEMKSMGANI